jgi:CubicO group peptidase (beta-lactamase class C family)
MGKAGVDWGMLETWLSARMRDRKIPGAALGVIQGGEVVYQQGLGVTSIEEGGVPVSPQTLFAIGSVTKLFTKTAVLCLAEEGRVDLDTRVSHYLPEFHVGAAWSGVTLRRLLSHTSGLPSEYIDEGVYNPAVLREHVEQQVARCRFLFPPGDACFYSNLALNLAGYVVEVVSGKPYPQMIAERILKPLGMTRSTFDPVVAMTYPLAQSHDLALNGTLAVRHRFPIHSAFMPSGGLLSCLAELLQFACSFLLPSSHRTALLHADTIERMFALEAPLYTFEESGFGLGFFVERYKGSRRVGAMGAIGSSGCVFMLMPDHGVAVVLLQNRVDDSFRQEVVDRVFDEVLQLTPEPPPQPRAPDESPAELAGLTGDYLSYQRGLVRIRLHGSRLVADWNGKEFVLDPWQVDRFIGRPSGRQAPIVPVGFVRKGEGPVRYVYLQGRVFQRMQLDPTFEPDRQRWQYYVGTFTNGYTSFALEIREEHLEMRMHGTPAGVLLLPIREEYFSSPLGLLEVPLHPEAPVEEVRFVTQSFRRMERYS